MIWIRILLAILVLMGGCEPEMKRWGLESFTSVPFLSSIGFFGVGKSGSNYMRFTTGGGNSNIKYYTDPEAVDGDWNTGLTWTSGGSLGAIHVLAGRVHHSGTTDAGGGTIAINYNWSDDDAVNWTEDEATIGEAGYDISATDVVLDVFKIGATPFAIVWSDDAGGTITIYDLTDFSIVENIDGVEGSAGYLEGGIYYFTETDADTRIYSFNGITVTEIEIASTVNSIFDPEKTILMKKGNTRFLILGTMPDYQLYRSINDDDWIEIDVALTAVDVKVSWEETEYTPRFIGVYDAAEGITDMYYINPSGSMIKISTSIAANIYSGLGAYMYPYKITPVAYNPASKVPITGGHFMPQVVQFTHVGSDYKKGDGIVLTDDSDNVKFMGNIPPEGGIKMAGTKMQKLVFFSPGKFDLMEKITYDFSAQTVPQMLTTDLLNTRYYYKGTFAAPATTYNYNCNQLPRWEFWKDLEQLALLRIHKSDEFGQIDLDNGTDDSGAVTTLANQVVKPIIETQGAGFNRVLVLGGPKADLTGLAKGVYNIPTASDQQINLVTYIKPNLFTDALCLTAATNIGDAVNSALIRYTFTMRAQGKPLEGEYISYAYAPLGIGAVNVIVESYTHELLSGWYSCTCYNALHWRGI